MNKSTKNSEPEQKKWRIIDNHIIGSMREGRMPGHADYEQLSEDTGITIEEIAARAEALAAEHRDEYGLHNKSDLEKIIHFIKQAGWRRNEVLGIIENRAGKHIPEEDIFISATLAGAKITQTTLRALLRSKYVTSFHPIREFFATLDVPGFDPNINYFEKLADYFNLDDRTYFAEMLRKHLIRAIDQVFRGTPNRFVFVFYSREQNIGKSIFIKWLNPLTDRYFSERPLRGDKDSELQLAICFLYSIEELEGLSRSEISKTKSYISRAVINERAPYAAEAIVRQRLATIFASTNDREFLTDISNTRWLVFDVKSIDFGYNNITTGKAGIDKHCLWLQAFKAWQADNSAGIMTSEERARQEADNKNYHVVTTEFQLIIKHFRQPTADDQPRVRNSNGGFDGDIEFLSATEILNRLAEKYPALKMNAIWIGREMRRAGFASILRKIVGITIRGYSLVFSDEGFFQQKNEPNEIPF